MHKRESASPLSFSHCGLKSVSTDAVCPRESVAYWTDQVCEHLVQAQCDQISKPDQFRGSIHLRQIGQVDVSQIVSEAQRVTRTKGQISHADKEYFLLNIQRQGTSLVQQGGREAALKEGDMALFSSARPYDLVFDAAFAQTVLIVPADELRLKTPNIDTLIATTLNRDNPITKLLTQVANGFFHTQFETLPQSAVARSADALTDILAATVDAFLPSRDEVVPHLAEYHLIRIKRFVYNHLHEPDLSIQKVARALNISAAHIHRLFELEPETFSIWMWSQRLFACKKALQNPTKAHIPITEIAFKMGFNNASHFSRAFRHKFGMTPSECRSRNLFLKPANT
jgi:AraC-like DNA-binding protein